MKLFDRLIDHVVDRAMARAKVAAEHQNHVHINVKTLADRSISYGATHAAKQAAAECERAMQHPGRTA